MQGAPNIITCQMLCGKLVANSNYIPKTKYRLLLHAVHEERKCSGCHRSIHNKASKHAWSWLLLFPPLGKSPQTIIKDDKFESNVGMPRMHLVKPDDFDLDRICRRI